MNDAVSRFETLRPRLVRHAVENDEAFLRTTIARLALDRLRSARARREVYVGPWLPEPVLGASPGPESAAVLADDAAALQQLMLDDVVLTADGGGKVAAATVPIAGAGRVIQFLLGVTRKFGHLIRRVELAGINGMPGIVLIGDDGILQTIALELRDGAIAAMYVTRNPEKLTRVARYFREDADAFSPPLPP